MTDDNDFDRRLDAAFASRAGGVHLTPPDIDELFSRGQQRTRRTLVAGSLGVLAIGAVGIFVFANAGGSTPQDALTESLPPVEQMASTTVSLDRTAWSCVGPMGTSEDGAVAFFESCTPGGSWSPYAPTTTTDVPVTTVVCSTDPISTAEATTTVQYCGDPIVAGDTTTTTSIESGDVVPTCTIPGCLTEYVVRTGDYPMRVAEMFCISVDELVAANGWAGPNAFPFPGVAITLPSTAFYCASANPTTTFDAPTTTAPA